MGWDGFVGVSSAGPGAGLNPRGSLRNQGVYDSSPSLLPLC